MIELHCNSCGKLVRAPREAAGRRAKCPNCGNSLYIPTPVDEIEELPLRPVDPNELQHEAALLAERRKLDRIIARATDEAPDSSPRSKRAESSDEPTHISVEDAVIAYLMAMRDSDLDRAQKWVDVLRQHSAEALVVIDRLAGDQIPPAAMANVPAGVYQGFLKNLRTHI